jgi:hypothetical protein
MMRCSVCVKSRPFDAHVVAAVAAEQVVDDQEHQLGVEHEQRRAAQRLQVHHVDVGRHRQVAYEVAVFLDLHRADRDVGAATHEGQQRAAQVARETLVDDLQRVHAAAHDALVRAEVVGRRALGAGGCALSAPASPVTPCSSASTSSCESCCS